MNAPRWKTSSTVLLIRHFLRRFFSSESDEYDLAWSGPGIVLAALVVPGALVTFSLFPKYSSLMRYFRQDFSFDAALAAIPDKHLFLSITIAVAGIATALKWQALFPDWRDYANLAPLPLTFRRIFLTKLAALLIWISALLVATNLAPAVAFPAIVMENRGTVGGLARFYVAHAVSMAAAGVFAFSCVLAFAGLLMRASPRVSRLAQVAVIGLLLSLLVLSPLAAGAGSSPYRYHAVTWFCGLYLELEGAPTPWSGPAAYSALGSLGASLALAAAGWFLGYRRFTAQILRTNAQTRAAILDKIFDAVSRSPFHQACLRFSVKALYRSERHAAVMAASAGVGISFAVSVVAGSAEVFVRPSRVSLSCALAFSYCVLLGARVALGLPVHSRANWQLSLCIPGCEPDVRGATRRALLLMLALSLLICMPPAVALWGVGTAFLHTTFVAVMGALLIEFLLLDVRTVPCMIANVTGIENPIFALAIALTGLGVYSQALGALELMLISGPFQFWVFLACGCGGYAALRRRQRPEPVLHERRSGSLELLRLSE